MEEDNYVYHREVTMKKVRIPKDCVKCPDCKGSGRIRVIYGPSWMEGQFANCLLCIGKGYVEKNYLEFRQRLERKAKINE